MAHALVGDIERIINDAFPPENAAPWDKNGLLVGKRLQEATGVYCALDPTLESIDATLACGANVLVTHHPVFLDPLDTLVPEDTYTARVVSYAIENGVALINAHTSLDIDSEAKLLLGAMVGAEPVNDTAFGLSSPYLAAWKLPSALSLGDLAKMYAATLGTSVRIVGRTDKVVSAFVSATGSAGSTLRAVIESDYDTIVLGELKYHDSLAAREQGLAVIELGHDYSEWPLVDRLYKILIDCSIDCPVYLGTPESTYQWITS